MKKDTHCNGNFVISEFCFRSLVHFREMHLQNENVSPALSFQIAFICLAALAGTRTLSQKQQK